jgi:hypothetical protein
MGQPHSTANRKLSVSWICPHIVVSRSEAFALDEYSGLIVISDKSLKDDNILFVQIFGLQYPFVSHHGDP